MVLKRVEYDPATGMAVDAVDREAAKQQQAEQSNRRDALVLATTPGIDGRSTTAYLGLVFGEAILGANLFSDMAAGVRDVVGGRSASYEGKMGDARRIALAEAQDQALELGANAIVGIRIDYETIKGSMLMVTAQGTAVVIS